MGEMEGFDLIDDPAAHELRVCEDPDDGTPDEDMPALDRNKDIREFERIVVLVPNPEFEESTPRALKRHDDSDDDQGKSPRKSPFAEYRKVEKKRFRNSMDVPGKKLVKIRTDEDYKGNEQTFVFNVPNSAMKMKDLLKIVTKKIKSNMSDYEVMDDMLPKDFRFEYVTGETIDMDAIIATVKSDEFKLVRKIPLPKAPKAMSFNPDLLQARQANNNTRTMSRQLAFAYSQYEVIKTNSRGRPQRRIIGIDEHYIYNKIVQKSAPNQYPRVSVDAHSKRSYNPRGKVKNAKRPITNVKRCMIIARKPQAFEITYEDKEKNEQTIRFKAETKMECREIVDKINFLIQHHSKQAKIKKKRLSSSGTNLSIH